MQYPFVQNLKFFDTWLLSETEKSKARLKSVQCLLVHCNRVFERDIDEIIRGYADYAASTTDKKSGAFHGL